MRWTRGKHAFFVATHIDRKVFNLKQMAATLQYLQENDLLEYEQLEKKAKEASDRFHALSDKITTIEAAATV